MNRALLRRDKKLYLERIANSLVTQMFLNPINIRWANMVENAKEHICFLSHFNNGCTVQKSVSPYFTAWMQYNYVVLETGEKFTSLECKIEKAMLLHKRCTEKKPSCQQQFLSARGKFLQNR